MKIRLDQQLLVSIKFYLVCIPTVYFSLAPDIYLISILKHHIF